MSSGADPDRLDEIESRQAFQDDAIASLNEALVGQQQRIAHLEKMLELMIERLRQSGPGGEGLTEEPPPPHY